MQTASNPVSTKLSTRLWWQSGVIYQIYPRSFKDTSGNGIGDLRGVIQKLDYLNNTLGVNALWLSPFYPSPMADFGYDISDYINIDPLFGRLADFDDLLTEAHARDMQLIIDLVPNHTSDQHPWFIESRSSRDNPKRDWYVWKDAKADGSPPNNWLSVFGGRAWEWDETTQQYYLHMFVKQQPDLNWRNPEVKEAMFDVIRFWLDRGVDGFRIDTAHLIMKDPDYKDNPVKPDPTVGGLHKPMADYDSLEHINDMGHPDIHAVYKEFHQLLDEYSANQPRVSIGEIHIPDLKQWVTYYGEKLDELHMPFNFGLLWTDWDATVVRQHVDAVEAALPEGAWPNYVLGNHDETRIATRLGAAQARVAAMLLLTSRGTPTLYYGDEIGMSNVPIPLEDQQDPWGINVPGFDLGRDPVRTPMQWDSTPKAGFTENEVAPWLPLANDYKAVNVEQQLSDEASILKLYQQLLNIRKNSPALHSGDYKAFKSTPKEVFAYQRYTTEQTFIITLNFSNQAQSIALSIDKDSTIIISTHLDRMGHFNADAFELRPNEGLLISLT